MKRTVIERSTARIARAAALAKTKKTVKTQSNYIKNKDKQ